MKKKKDLDEEIEVNDVVKAAAIGAVIVADKIVENVIDDDDSDNEKKDVHKLDKMDVIEKGVKVAAIGSVLSEINDVENEQLDDETNGLDEENKTNEIEVNASINVALVGDHDIIGTNDSDNEKK
eukprot:58259_1